MPTCWIVAGPNGAGKTTFAMKYLPKVAQCTRFINADLIAAGLSPLAPERELLTASRLLLREIDACIASGHDFASAFRQRDGMRSSSIWLCPIWKHHAHA